MFFKLALVRLTRRLRARRSIGFSFVGMVVVVSVLLNALLFWFFDRDAHGDEMLGFDEALWYSIISITTIGYGDYSA
ncbi:MAG: ion channel, partial [Bacteroidota bacterium]